ncbi:NUDIX hydrolase [Aliishimia ponticola]|uniref:NUDIX hydrolase n=1 Tax=Aliishimia ponticola TaxID=2499833 RepID=A0A4S4NE11_9RHOB|nr:NUDIX hydrolase [Aliishimia ponticola]THH36985.1 NUDIX hydrolase [Aliishimia ponticola]
MTDKLEKRPRVAVRAIIVQDGRLLLVNAWGGGRSDLLCAPGGGVDLHASLPDNLKREVREETGLEIAVGAVCLVNEFHAPGSDFHQVDIYFRCSVIRGTVDPGWVDPEGVVTERHWVTRAELTKLRYKPDSLPDVAFGAPDAITYDALEPLVR